MAVLHLGYRVRTKGLLESMVKHTEEPGYSCPVPGCEFLGGEKEKLLQRWEKVKGGEGYRLVTGPV